MNDLNKIAYGVGQAIEAVKFLKHLVALNLGLTGVLLVLIVVIGKNDGVFK